MVSGLVSLLGFARGSRPVPEGQSMVAIRPMAGTVPAQSALPVEVVFSPTTEEAYNYNLVCRVKKKTTSLTCNLKGEVCRGTAGGWAVELDGGGKAGSGSYGTHAPPE